MIFGSGLFLKWDVTDKSEIAIPVQNAKRVCYAIFCYDGNRKTFESESREFQTAQHRGMLLLL